MENDFSTTGTCSYYLTQDKIMATDSALAFPVRQKFSNDMQGNAIDSVSETKPFLGGNKQFHSPC